jgi:hypothetical protein
MLSFILNLLQVYQGLLPGAINIFYVIFSSHIAVLLWHRRQSEIVNFGICVFFSFASRAKAIFLFTFFSNTCFTRRENKVFMYGIKFFNRTRGSCLVGLYKDLTALRQVLITFLKLERL